MLVCPWRWTFPGEDKRSVRVREIPQREQIPVQCEASLVIEYYSR